jgi:hypothetical protein
VACLAAVLLLVHSPPLRAASQTSCAGVNLPAKERAFDVDLVLNGMGLRTATIFNIHVYVAGLYLERPTNKASDVLAHGRTKLVTMTYLRDGTRQQMTDVMRDGFAKQSAQTQKAVKKHMPDLERRLPEPRKGGRLVLAYGKGQLEMRYNGKVRGRWDDPEFAAGLFSLWLGSEPVDSSLKEGLLGGECD